MFVMEAFEQHNDDDVKRRRSEKETWTKYCLELLVLLQIILPVLRVNSPSDPLANVINTQIRRMAVYGEGPRSLSTGPMSMSMSMSMTASGSYIPLPEFVNIDSKYKCVHCGQVLQVPQQTPCGHRISQCCLDELLANQSETNEPIRCPANEEGCEILTKETMCPDYPVIREMKQLKVFCFYRLYGCQTITTWNKYKDHYLNCPHRVQDCEFCNESISTENLQHHIDNDCPMVVCPCEFNCDDAKHGIKRSEMVDHLTHCNAKPRKCSYSAFGCGFEGTLTVLPQHENESFQIHLNMLMNYILHHRIGEPHDMELKEQDDDVSTDSEDRQVTEENKQLKSMVETYKAEMEKMKEQHDQILRAQNDKLSNLSFQMESLLKEVNQLRSTQSQTNATLAKAEQRNETLEASLKRVKYETNCLAAASYDGTFLWCVRGYKGHKAAAVAGQTLSLFSPPFYTSRYGYKLCLRVYFDGDGEGKSHYISLFIVIMQGDFDDLLAWPFRQKITLSLVDQSGSSTRGHQDYKETFMPDPNSNSYEKPTRAMNVATGCPKFIDHRTIESSDSRYLKNDTVYFKVIVDVDGL